MSARTRVIGFRSVAWATTVGKFGPHSRIIIEQCDARVVAAYVCVYYYFVIIIQCLSEEAHNPSLSLCLYVHPFG